MKTIASILLALCMAAFAACQTPPPELKPQQDAAQAASVKLLDDAYAQIAALKQDVAAANQARDAAVAARTAAEVALAAEKQRTAQLQQQLSTAVATTKTKAETAAVAAIRAVQ